MSWAPFQLPKVPPQISTFGQTLASASDSLTTLLQTLQAAAKVLSRADLTVADATQAALQAAINELTAEIDALSGNVSALNSTSDQVGVYLLMIPARRRVVIQAALAQAMAAAGITDLPPIPTDSAVGKLLSSAGSSKFISTVPGATGGNAGFVRTVVESLVDQNDPNRPQLDANMQVTGAVMVAGSDSFANVAKMGSLISSIFATERPADALEFGEAPSPRDVLAIQVAEGVQLSWAASGFHELAPTFGTVFDVKQVAIVRSTNPKLLSATTVASVFGSTTLTVGASSGYAEVLAVLDTNVNKPVTSYLDESATDTQAYYYAVAYRVTVDSTDLGFGRFSAVRKVKLQSKPPRTSKAQPPDWIRSPSALGLLPDLSNILTDIRAQLTQLGSTGADFKALSDSYVAQVDAEIAAYATVAQNVNNKIQTLSSLLATPIPVGAYFRAFSGTGGNTFIVQDLITSMAAADSTRPPFDTGDEFVLGFMILAAAPTSAALAPVNNILNLLFGTGDTVQSAISKAMELVTAGVDKAIEDVTAELLAANVYGTSPTPIGVPKVGSDDDGTNQNC